MDNIIEKFESENKTQSESKWQPSIDSLSYFTQITNSLSEEQKNEAKKEIIDFIKHQQDLKNSQPFQNINVKIDMIFRSIVFAGLSTFVFSIFIRMANFNKFSMDSNDLIFNIAPNLLIILISIILTYGVIKFAINTIPKNIKKR